MLFLSANSGVAAAKRLALVIGNSDYKHANQLKRAKEDAKVVAEILERHGFEGATPRGDLSKEKMVLAVDEFLSKIRPNDIAVFFYAGHGVQHEGTNFLIPVEMPHLDADPSTMLEAYAVPFNGDSGLLGRFEKKRRKFVKDKQDAFGIFILDACRKYLQKSAASERFMDTTLAGLGPIAPVGGTFIMYSAEAGQAALEDLGDDDRDANGVYTRELMKLIDKADLDVVDIAKEVKWRVYDLSLKAKRPQPQVPVYYDGFIHRTSILGTRLQTPRREHQMVALLDDTKEARLVAATRGPTERSLGGTPQVAPVKTIVDCEGCPELVIVRGQPFTIGSPASEPGHQPHEQQAEIALMHQYAVGKYEVTWGEWQACVRSKRPERCDEVDAKGYADADKFDGGRVEPAAAEVEGTAGGNTGGLPDHRRPMIYVTWDQAQQYVKYLSAVTGKRYRLPSEAEWEYAARGGTKGRFSFVDGTTVADDAKKRRIEAELCRYANGADRGLKMWLWPSNADCDDRFGASAAPVGSFKPNPFGLYDVHGNVWEWVNECWRDRHTASDGRLAAADMASNNCTRTARGGSWHGQVAALRSASRTGFGRDHARRTLGFRVARDVVQAAEADPTAD
ncbi:MAG: SUMF1/EgtB/PvdO family nonheme iron enzyme [Hyphomicrobium sp.]